MQSRFTRRTRLFIYCLLLVMASCGSGGSSDRSSRSKPAETSTAPSLDTTATVRSEQPTDQPAEDPGTVTASPPPTQPATTPDKPEEKPATSGSGTGSVTTHSETRSGGRAVPPRTITIEDRGPRATAARPSGSISRPELTIASDSIPPLPEALPAAAQKDSMALSTLAYSYFDTIAENETRYIWAKIKSNSTKSETVALLKDYIQHVMAQPPKASDTNSIKSIYIKGYRFVTITPDPSTDFDIALVDGEARQELDMTDGNNWRWSVKLKAGVKVPQSSITLRIKATNNINGLKDFEDQQIIMIDVKIVAAQASGADGRSVSTEKHNKGTLIAGIITAVLLSAGFAFRKKLARLAGIRKKPQIFFSYAWGQEREQFVDQLYDSLKADGYIVVRDKMSLGYKGVISKFMTSIGKGQFIVVAISDKYLTSEYCMFELFEIFRNAKMEKEELIKRIYPVCIENLNLKSPPVIARYLKFWEDKEQEWEALVTHNPDSISEEQQANYTRVKRIIAYLGALLDFLSDVNFLDQQQLSADNFQQIKTAVEARISEEDS